MSDQDIWHWRNCRSVGFSFSFWLWPWAMGAYREEDVFGGERGIHIGPITCSISYSMGLSKADAYVRAHRYEGRVE